MSRVLQLIITEQHFHARVLLQIPEQNHHSVCCLGRISIETEYLVAVSDLDSNYILL
jgi:hypothetical protein